MFFRCWKKWILNFTMSVISLMWQLVIQCMHSYITITTYYIFFLSFIDLFCVAYYPWFCMKVKSFTLWHLCTVTILCWICFEPETHWKDGCYGCSPTLVYFKLYSSLHVVLLENSLCLIELLFMLMLIISKL